MSASIRRHAIRLAGVAAFAVVSARAGQSQPIPSDSAIQAILKARVDSGRAPGIVVGVLENGRRRYVAYGPAGPGRGRLDEHTVFEIGSISKTFTGLLLADAVVRGEVRLDQPVGDLLPAGTALVERRITGPLGMRETWVDVPAEARARVDAGHDPAPDTVPVWHLDALAGAGALRSTAADMLTYLAAELDTTRGPLARAVALGRQPRAGMGPGSRIGLGWIVGGPTDRPIWWHNGGTAGFATYAAFDPARQAAVVVLADASVGPDDIGVHLLSPSVPLRMPRVPPRRTAVTLPASALDRVAGAYQLAPGAVLQVTRQGDQLFVQLTGQEKVPLFAAAPDRFFLRVVDAELHFARAATGPATSATLLQNGRSQVAPRVPGDSQR